MRAARAATTSRDVDVRDAIFREARDGPRCRRKGGGSGVDVAASTWGGVLSYVARPEPDARPIALPAGLSFVAFWSGSSARTSDLLARVAAFRARDPHATRYASAPSPPLRSAARHAIARVRLPRLPRRRAAQPRAPSPRSATPPTPPSSPPPSPRLAGWLAEREGSAFFPSGAGGGDVGIWLGPSAPSADFIAHGRALGMRPSSSASDSAGVRRHPEGGLTRHGPHFQVPGFYKVSVDERRALVRDKATGADRAGDRARSIRAAASTPDTADKFVENVLGTYALPYGVALNVRVDGKDHVVPMVVEEPSVVAAASNAAKMVRLGGGFTSDVDAPLMISQIQLIDVGRRPARHRRHRGARHRDHGARRRVDPRPRRPRRRRKRSVEVRALGDARTDRMMVVHIIVDCRDAMGANLMNTVAEACAELLAEIAKGKVGLRILTNLCDKRLVRDQVPRPRRRRWPPTTWTARTSSTAS